MSEEESYLQIPISRTSNHSSVLPPHPSPLPKDFQLALPELPHLTLEKLVSAHRAHGRDTPHIWGVSLFSQRCNRILVYSIH